MDGGSGGGDGRHVALVTGAARGFGGGIARGLVAAGWAVLAVDLPGPELHAAERELRALKAGGQSSTAAPTHGSGVGRVLPCDVCDYEEVVSAVRHAVGRWGRLDLVVANAAVLEPRRLADTSPREWEASIRINLTGVWHTWRAAWAVLASQPRGGHLLVRTPKTAP
jgi:NAD(P)-dependent dehydrogenase (short-subunit alcohol dehydrogenase family)